MTDVPIPFLNRPENIVRYEDGAVLVLDRRVYPFERTFVRCATYEDVAPAIEAMVTQSLGPGPTAGYGMAQAARAVRGLAAARQEEALRTAAARLVATRPTNNQIRLVVGATLEAALGAVAAGGDAESAVLAAMDAHWARHLGAWQAIGRAGAPLIRAGARSHPPCWADARLE